ncbi:MAG: helix-turn-helix domain-containing protein [Acetatifactor sp.]|nr:helix-turn-helix domain-containing protein [Acetatifactor sp.]
MVTEDFGKKILSIRQNANMAQGELAMRLGVAPQAISKWESGGSIPDLDKIIKLSNLFGVSTDYLLKEEIEELAAGEGMALTEAEEAAGRAMSVEEAEEFLRITKSFAKMIGLGVVLCILSPVSLILLTGMSEAGMIVLSEDLVGGVGVVVLLLLIAVAVAIFIINGIHYSKNDYLEQEKIWPGYGVEGTASKRKEAFRGTFSICITIGVGLCILGVVPVILVGVMEAGVLAQTGSVCVLLAMIAVAVYLFVWSGITYGSYDKLLQIGDYTKENKDFNKFMHPVAGIYWCLATAIYLFWSFRSNRWEDTWIMWPAVAVLYAAVIGIMKIVWNIYKKRNRER